ncbi:hypothetical protein [Pseudoalteromonas sp. ZZD1]|uniref:hypothetical protein n=1 Tax=Pseudoalteromonas sp. ZZD1 TaxID=3139395 RepID=UPI003BACD3FA
MIEPNYQNYTLQELLEAQETIDKEQFPLRYQQLCAQINLKQNDPQQVALVEQKKYLNNLIFAKVILALLSCFFAFELYSSWQFGVASFRKSEYSLADNPQMFYFIIFTHSILLFVFLIMLIRNSWVKQAEMQS